MGRSTGRLFKEKGVSLYKDKEISTTHAKVGCHSFPLLYHNFYLPRLSSRMEEYFS